MRKILWLLCIAFQMPVMATQSGSCSKEVPSLEQQVQELVRRTIKLDAVNVGTFAFIGYAVGLSVAAQQNSRLIASWSKWLPAMIGASCVAWVFGSAFSESYENRERYRQLQLDHLADVNYKRIFNSFNEHYMSYTTHILIPCTAEIVSGWLTAKRNFNN